MMIRRTDLGSPAARPLAWLLKDLVDSRAVLSRARAMLANHAESCDEARARVLRALEAYTTALEAQRLPVPYALRDELRIRRGVTR